MAVRILGLNCSPRDNSNSQTILEYSLSRIQDKFKEDFTYEIVNLRELNIMPCIACNVCGKRKDTGEFIPCVNAQNDDAQAVLDKMIAADGIAVATPVYFGMPSHLFSNFIMRLRVLRHQDFKLRNTVVGVMAIAGRRSGGAETTITQVWLPFIRNNCLIVGNGNRTSQYGVMGWAGPRKHILSDEWGLQQALDTVERIYGVAALIKAGTEAIGYSPDLEFCYKSGVRPHD